MDILVWLIFGAISGYIASSVMNTGHSLLTDIILGIIGAFVGGWIFNTFGEAGVTGFNLYSILVAVIGAMVVIYLSRLFYR